MLCVIRYTNLVAKVSPVQFYTISRFCNSLQNNQEYIMYSIDKIFHWLHYYQNSMAKTVFNTIQLFQTSFKLVYLN